MHYPKDYIEMVEGLGMVCDNTTEVDADLLSGSRVPTIDNLNVPRNQKHVEWVTRALGIGKASKR